ncbi:hypothetical protein HUK65_15010 [Rhodobacteraceae bacterium 2376]|uniref:LPS-assembly lipoprotein n=2 Tax=Rhabdonatronobacter sediminivivens TaxID=2743469 RepID=A0A7Z0I2C0_9RHOB|nr:hypothetical protein [Rhabdonatronobacter sediminivivens]
MWLSERRAMLTGLLALPVAAACGFSPAHAPGGPGAALRGQVRADDPRNVRDSAFVAALEDRLGRPQAARFALSHDISVSESGGARMRRLGDTRFQVFGRVHFALRDIASDSELYSGTVRNFTAYSATSTQLATLAAQEDAERRLMVILADQVVARLLAVLADVAAP